MERREHKNPDIFRPSLINWCIMWEQPKFARMGIRGQPTQPRNKSMSSSLYGLHVLRRTESFSVEQNLSF